MKKTKEQILKDCTNEHDRKLLIKGFDRGEKIYNKSRLLLGIALFFLVVSIFGVVVLENEYFLFSFIPVFPLLIWSQVNILKGSGLI